MILQQGAPAPPPAADAGPLAARACSSSEPATGLESSLCTRCGGRCRRRRAHTYGGRSRSFLRLPRQRRRIDGAHRLIAHSIRPTNTTAMADTSMQNAPLLTSTPSCRRRFHIPVLKASFSISTSSKRFIASKPVSPTTLAHSRLQ